MIYNVHFTVVEETMLIATLMASMSAVYSSSPFSPVELLEWDLFLFFLCLEA